MKFKLTFRLVIHSLRMALTLITAMVSSAKKSLSSESTSSTSEVAWTALKSPTEYFARIVLGASVSAFSYKVFVNIEIRVS